MSGLLKRLSFQTGQARKVTYYRPTIFGKDNYGVEDGSVDAHDITIPQVPAYIRNKTDKNFCCFSVSCLLIFFHLSNLFN